MKPVHFPDQPKGNRSVDYEGSVGQAQLVYREGLLDIFEVIQEYYEEYGGEAGCEENHQYGRLYLLHLLLKPLERIFLYYKRLKSVHALKAGEDSQSLHLMCSLGEPNEDEALTEDVNDIRDSIEE